MLFHQIRSKNRNLLNHKFISLIQQKIFFQIVEIRGQIRKISPLNRTIFTNYKKTIFLKMLSKILSFLDLTFYYNLRMCLHMRIHIDRT
jgi:hypothetical protein